MLYGIVVISLTKAVKYTVLYLCLFVRFSDTFLHQIKVCSIVIHYIWLVWFMDYNALTNTFFKSLWKKYFSATENVGGHLCIQTKVYFGLKAILFF